MVNGSTLKNLGLDVRRARKERGWTQEALAKEAAVALTLVGKIERGRAVSDTTLRAVARTLDLPDEAVTPHLTEAVEGPASVAAVATVADFRRELAYFHRRFRESPEDYARLLDLLDLYAALSDSPVSTQGSTQIDAQG